MYVYTELDRIDLKKQISKEIMNFYYKRNRLLKLFYGLFVLLTLVYAIYGIVVFFKGNYFKVWLNN